VPLRIAFDLDGVVADMEAELVRQAEILFGPVMTDRLHERTPAPDRDAAAADQESAGGAELVPHSADDADAEPQAEVETSPDNTPPLLKLNMTPRQQRKLWRHVETIENFWETLRENEPGVIARLAKLAGDRRWEIIFLTKRPQTAGATAQVQSQRWLESKGFPLPSVFVVQGSRGRIAAALDLAIVIDDRPENCLDVVVDSKARAILVWRESEKQLPGATRRLGIGVVKSTAECLDILAEIDAPRAGNPGMMDRVKRLLGLKEPARA
jgi:hypothetical protein